LARPRRPLPRTEREVEQIVLALLDAGRPPEGPLWSAMIGTSALPARAPAGYRPVLPCPLWGDCWTREVTPARVDDDERSQNPQQATPDARKRFAVRERDDDASRRDPFVLNRFEKILAMAEMVNVDRPADDSEDEDARKAADDLEELAIGRRTGRPATRLKFDLDLPPEAVDATRLEAGGFIRNGIIATAPILRIIAGCWRPRRPRPEKPGHRTRACAAISVRCGVGSRRCGRARR
jgi:nitric oxide reductase NorD protein